MTVNHTGQSTPAAPMSATVDAKKAAVLVEYHVCEPFTTPLPTVGWHWQHPRLPEVRGMCRSYQIEDRGGMDIVRTAVIARWVLE